MTSFVQVNSSQPCVHLSPHTCYMPRPFHPPKNNRGAVQIMRILITQFSPVYCQSLPLPPNPPSVSCSSLNHIN